MNLGKPKFQSLGNFSNEWIGVGRVGLGVSHEVGGGLGKGVVVRSGKGKTIWWKMLEEMPYLIICFCLCLCGEKVGCYACRQTEFSYFNSKRIQIEFAKSSRYGKWAILALSRNGETSPLIADYQKSKIQQRRSITINWLFNRDSHWWKTYIKRNIFSTLILGHTYKMAGHTITP